MGGRRGSEDCGGSGMVMKRGDSGGMGAAGRRVVGVLLKGRRQGAAVRGLVVLVRRVLVVVVVVVEMRQEERAAWRPHIDGRERGDAIVGC